MSDNGLAPNQSIMYGDEPPVGTKNADPSLLAKQLTLLVVIVSLKGLGSEIIIVSL